MVSKGGTEGSIFRADRPRYVNNPRYGYGAIDRTDIDPQTGKETSAVREAVVVGTTQKLADSIANQLDQAFSKGVNWAKIEIKDCMNEVEWSRRTGLSPNSTYCLSKKGLYDPADETSIEDLIRRGL